MLLATALPGLLYALMPLVVHPVFSIVLFYVQYGTMSLRRLRCLGLLIGAVADRSLMPAFLLMGSIILPGAALWSVDERYVIPRPVEWPSISGQHGPSAAQWARRIDCWPVVM